MKLRKIAVPVDGSAAAEIIVDRAVDMAREAGATIVLVRTAEVRIQRGADRVDAELAAVREAENHLARVKARLAADGFADVLTSVWCGPAAPAIAEAARRHGADLIVMTTHCRKGIGRFIVGSVAESVLCETDTPILLLRASEPPPVRSGEVSQAQERDQLAGAFR